MLFGVGTSYPYFHEIDINGEPHYQENPEFANQFYPASLNIGPSENTFAKNRSPDSIRVYILGGSAAMGFPYKNHGLDRLLAAQLRAALPARKIEVINTAMTSVNSHVVYAVAKSIPESSADVAVILMGNNEVVGPYGPGTFNQNFLSSIAAIRAIQALKRTRLWQGLDRVIQRIKPTDAREELEWEGMQMFTSHGVPHDDSRMASVYSHYENNLVDTIQTLQNKGIHVLLSSVPVNLRHSAPFLSVHDASLSDEQLSEWQSFIRSGAEAVDNGNWGAAITQFQAALKIDPEYADTHFRLATAFENLGDLPNAEAHYKHALDFDALRFRADTRINDIIQQVASRRSSDAFNFVDSAAAFGRASHPFQPGWNLFLEHVHYDFSGNHVMAAELSRSIVSNLANIDDFQSLPEVEVAERIGFPNYDTIEEIKNLQGMIQHPPFPGQSNYNELKHFLDQKIANVSNSVGTQQVVIERRKEVTDTGLADWKVHFELAVLYQRLRNPPAMYYHLNRIIEIYPHNRETYMKIAEAMSREGRWREVIPHLEQSLYYTRGDAAKIAETINWLGTAYLRIGDYDKAKTQLLQVASDYPEQIDLVFRAYGNLIKYARDTNKDDDLARFVDDAERYGRALLREDKDKEYPLLHKRMSQLMIMGGYTAEAAEWASTEKQ